MPESRVPGRSVVTRRAIVDIVRPAVSGSYGVLGFAEPNVWRRIARILRGREAGIRVSLRDGIAIDLHLSVAYGLPIAEVARQADSAVRDAIRRSLGQEVARLTVHVRGMRFQPVGLPPAAEDATAPHVVVAAEVIATEPGAVVVASAAETGAANAADSGDSARSADSFGAAGAGHTNGRARRGRANGRKTAPSAPADGLDGGVPREERAIRDPSN